MRHALCVVAALMCTFSALSALGGVEVTSLAFPDGKPRILVTMKGAITGDELQTLQREIDPKRSPFVVVFVESPGGDWNAALTLGRFLRNIGAAVHVTQQGCYSSCVLLLAAGVRRQVMGPVGIHRPYSTDLTPQTFSEAQRRYRVLEAATKKYLLEMNLPESLFDAMIRTPPESIRKLTSLELERFGLSQDDPVAQEIDDAEEAREFGLSKEEYLRRKARRESVCQPQDLGPERIKDSVDSYMNCRKAVMQGRR
jgi:hypothetical protein